MSKVTTTGVETTTIGAPTTTTAEVTKSGAVPLIDMGSGAAVSTYGSTVAEATILAVLQSYPRAHRQTMRQLRMQIQTEAEAQQCGCQRSRWMKEMRTLPNTVSGPRPQYLPQLQTPPGIPQLYQPYPKRVGKKETRRGASKYYSQKGLPSYPSSSIRLKSHIEKH